jgi:hypothetical protein
MDRPVIGLCTALERARWSVWDQEAYLLPRSYVDAVQRAGGVALMLPPDERALDDPDALLGPTSIPTPTAPSATARRSGPCPNATRSRSL